MKAYFQYFNFPVCTDTNHYFHQVTPGHKNALEVITYVGCALSLLGEALTIVAYWTLM